MGFLPSWAPWAELGPTPSLLLSLFFSAADSLGPRVGVSGIPCGFFSIRCELQRVCACVSCVCRAGSPRRGRDVAAWARRRRDSARRRWRCLRLLRVKASPWLRHACTHPRKGRRGGLVRAHAVEAVPWPWQAAGVTVRRRRRLAAPRRAEAFPRAPVYAHAHGGRQARPWRARARRNGARQVASAAVPWHAGGANQRGSNHGEQRRRLGGLAVAVAVRTRAGIGFTRCRGVAAH